MARPISQTLFDLLAIGTRRSITTVMSTELSWWSTLEGNILGTVFRDTCDQDYGWILLVRDLVGRFRCADIQVSFRTERIAMARLRIAMAEKNRDTTFTGLEEQGDEPKAPLDCSKNVASLTPAFTSTILSYAIDRLAAQREKSSKPSRPGW